MVDGAAVGTACNGQVGIVAAAAAAGISGVPRVGDMSPPGWISPVVQVSVSAGQKVLVNGSATLGSTAAGGAAGLQLHVCYARVGTGKLVMLPPGVWGLQVPQNSRQTFSLSFVVPDIPESGTYLFGLCGYADSGASASNWNSNDLGYVSAVVMN
jgi:hypothetical protein